MRPLVPANFEVKTVALRYCTWTKNCSSFILFKIQKGGLRTRHVRYRFHDDHPTRLAETVWQIDRKSKLRKVEIITGVCFAGSTSYFVIMNSTARFLWRFPINHQKCLGNLLLGRKSHRKPTLKSHVHPNAHNLEAIGSAGSRLRLEYESD